MASKKNKKRKRRRLNEDILDDEVQEEEENDEGQEYLFFDIESRQDDGRHIANLLIVQDQTGLKWFSRERNASNSLRHGY